MANIRSVLSVAAVLAALGCAESSSGVVDSGSERRPDAVKTARDGGSGTSKPGQVDAGNVARDAGSTARDAGTTARDAGSTPRDAGSAPRDAGTSPTIDAGASAADAASAPRDPAISLEQAMKDYLKWSPRQDAARAISVEIFSLCRLPSLPEQKFTESVHGNSLALRDWTNDLALQGLTAKDKPFPAGAAIVKQKLQGTKLVALGIMVKHAKGYDPAHGDWAFGYWEEASGLKGGAEPASACGDCHASAKTDYVFADASWRMPQ